MELEKEKNEYIKAMIKKLPDETRLSLSVEETGVYVDDKLLVIYSPGYGSGWTSHWNRLGGLATYPPLALWLLLGNDPNDLKKNSEEQQKVFKFLKHEDYEEIYFGGVNNLVLGSVERGKLWRVNDYDGSESIEILDAESWNRA